MLIIGSTATKLREPKDLDIFITREQLKQKYGKSSKKNFITFMDGDVRVDAFVSQDKSDAIAYFLELTCSEWAIETASDRVSLAIKNAHKHFYKFRYKKSFKHLIDRCALIDRLIEETGTAQLNTSFRRASQMWHNELLLGMKPEHLKMNMKFPSLKNNTKDKFFTEKVTYFYDHDDLHEIMAHYDEPLYKCQQPNGEQVYVWKDLFNEMSHEDKCKQALEEAYVIALERCLIPVSYGKLDVAAFGSIEALKWALTRIATNLTSGWFRTFVTDHFKEIYEMRNPDYYNVFLANRNNLKLLINVNETN